ncbi:hypothetical protein RvY_17362 [Ramazzottius varieornatus]|uniref:Uncharacterized protein n=1 Tax=Ramazzottius varieornatus TaxID=947166 RepID=A0A1D1W1V8_RAMVA|nr:hypothetical protein RvY_17362 [Ramazzottius varieornatus]
MVDLPQLFCNCKKITFMNVTYSDKWVTLALISVCRGAEVRFANCRIKLSWLNSTENKPRALLSSSVPINSCEPKVRMMCLSVGNDDGVVECYRKLRCLREGKPNLGCNCVEELVDTARSFVGFRTVEYYSRLLPF